MPHGVLAVVITNNQQFSLMITCNQQQSDSHDHRASRDHLQPVYRCNLPLTLIISVLIYTRPLLLQPSFTPSPYYFSPNLPPTLIRDRPVL